MRVNRTTCRVECWVVLDVDLDGSERLGFVEDCSLFRILCFDKERAVSKFRDALKVSCVSLQGFHDDERA